MPNEGPSHDHQDHDAKRHKPQPPEQALQGLEGAREASVDPAVAFQRATCAPPPAVSPNDILSLQRTVGNEAVGRILAERNGAALSGGPLLKPFLQAKLTVNPPGDTYEREADRMSGKVMGRISGSRTESAQRQEEEEEELQAKPVNYIQRQEEEGEELQMMPADFIGRQAEEEEEELQTKPVNSIQRQEEEEEEIQMRPAAAIRRSGAGSVPEVDGETEGRIDAARGSGESLDQGTREPMERAFGADFSGVRVHTDGQANELSQSLKARAFTTGQDIFFKGSEYEPRSASGQQLIAHELTHVMQQNQVSKAHPASPGESERTEAGGAVGRDRAAPDAGAMREPVREKVAGGPTIQGMFGFELELNVAVEQMGTKTIWDKVRKRSVIRPYFRHPPLKLGKAKTFILKMDHHTATAIGHTMPPGATPKKYGRQTHPEQEAVDPAAISWFNGEPIFPIIEIVTDPPIDEFADDATQKLNAHIEEILDFEEQVRLAIGGRDHLRDLGVDAPRNLVVGGKHKRRQHTKADIQATYALRLDQYQKAIERHKDILMAQGRSMSPEVKVLTRTKEVGSAVFESVKKGIKGPRKYGLFGPRMQMSAKEDQQLEGFLSMLANSVCAFNMPQDRKKLKKNQLGMFFFKSDMTDVVKRLSPQQQRYLSKNSKKIARMILGEAKLEDLHTDNQFLQDRNPEESRGQQEAWVRDILRGKKDVFLSWKNQYSEAIDPYDIGREGGEQSLAAVVENRHPELLLGRGVQRPASEWRRQMLTVFNLLRRINKAMPPRPRGGNG